MPEFVPPTSYLHSGSITEAINNVVPAWLHFVSQQIIESAKSYASRFGSANRKFWYEIHSATGTINLHQSVIYCSGPFVEATAFDLEFSVPVGGFKYGDIDPMTGEPFPGGKGEHGSYITLVDKGESAGEEIKNVSRTYTKYSGQTIRKSGFFDQSIRKNFGQGAILSSIGADNLRLLAVALGQEIAKGVAEQIKNEANRMGYEAFVGLPYIVTIERPL